MEPELKLLVQLQCDFSLLKIPYQVAEGPVEMGDGSWGWEREAPELGHDHGT